MIDTHAHFSREAEGYSIDEQVARARAAGVAAIVAVGGSDELNASVLQACTGHAGYVWPAVGFDRDQTARWEHPQEAVTALRGLIEQLSAGGMPAVAVGEAGLDYHYHPETASAQCELFASELAVSRELGLPVIVHSREADEDTLRLLGEHAAAWSCEGVPPGVLHCFTGGQAFADALVAMGFMISFSGILTFRNADSLRAVAATLPRDVLVVETDSPYLAPVPMRSHRNEPAFVSHTLACLASVRGEAVEELAAVTNANARRLFGLPGGRETPWTSER